MMRIKGIVGGVENLLAVLFEVIELAAVQGPSEYAEDDQHEHRGHRDQEIQDVHTGSA